MSFTEFDPRLQGAKRAIPWPTVFGDPVAALMVASPTSGHLMFVDLLAKVQNSTSLDLGTIGPRSIAIDTLREEGWVWCDDGTVVRVDADVANSKLVLVELARATKIHEPNFASWATLVRSVADTARRINRLPALFPPGTGLGASQRLRRTSNTDQRIIDVRSHLLICGPVGPGTIAFYSTEQPGINELYRVSGVTPRVEAGTFDPDTGYLYVVDSSGDGCILRVDPNNTVVLAARFQFSNVQGPVSAQIIDGELFITNERQNRVLVWDLTDPEVPVLVRDETYATGLYWERNPVRFVYTDGVTVIRKFGSLTSLLDHGDYPTEEAGAVAVGVPFEWALHGEIGGITYTLPIIAATYKDTTSTVIDSLLVITNLPYRYTRLSRPSVVNPTFTYTAPGIRGVTYEIRLRVRGRIEGKTYTKGAAAEINAFGAAELGAGYDPLQTQPTLVRNIRWGTWTPAVDTMDNPFVTIAAPGQANYAKFFVAASDEPGTVHDAYTRVIDSILKLRINGRQTIVLTLDWGGDAFSVIPAKVLPTGVDDLYVTPANIALMPPDDDPTHPLVVPWSPRFLVDPVLFNSVRRPFVQLDITHIQQAPGY